MLFQGKLKKETRDYERYAEYIASYDQIDPLLLNIWLQKIREQRNPRDNYVLAKDLLPFDHVLNALDRPRSYFELIRKAEDHSLSSSIETPLACTILLCLIIMLKSCQRLRKKNHRR